MLDLTVGIITDGRRRGLLRSVVGAIRSQAGNSIPILVAGVETDLEGCTCISMPKEAQEGRLGAMRNALVTQATTRECLLLDDDMILLEGFFDALGRFGRTHAQIGVSVFNPDGTHYWDSCAFALGPPRRHEFIPHEAEDPCRYVTGGAGLYDTVVARSVGWSPDRRFYQGEDIDFSERLRSSGRTIGFCAQARALHADNRYTSIDGQVHNLGDWKTCMRRTAGRALNGKYRKAFRLALRTARYFALARSMDPLLSGVLGPPDRLQGSSR